MATEKDKYDTAHHGIKGGRPNLEKQAENAHVKGEVRIDQAMADGIAPVIKEIKKMHKNLGVLKENTKWSFMLQTLKHNKDFMKALKEDRAAKKAANDSPADDADEDFSKPLISLTADPSPSKSLN